MCASAAEFCRREKVEAIAVCLLHSYANPAHEVRCGEILREVAPEIPVTLSHEITQEWREYERTNTAVLNSYVLPTARFYLTNLEKNLAELGMASLSHHAVERRHGHVRDGQTRAHQHGRVRAGGGRDRRGRDRQTDRRAQCHRLRRRRHDGQDLAGRERQPAHHDRVQDRVAARLCRLSRSWHPR